MHLIIYNGIYKTCSKKYGERRWEMEVQSVPCRNPHYKAKTDTEHFVLVLCPIIHCFKLLKTSEWRDKSL